MLAFAHYDKCVEVRIIVQRVVELVIRTSEAIIAVVFVTAGRNVQGQIVANWRLVRLREGVPGC